MVASGFFLGFLTGGFPERAREISQAALVIATTFALTEISFRGISPRAEARGFLLALTMNYVALGGLILAFGSQAEERAIHDGWVLMAAVPPAIAVVPITAYLRGNTRRTLLSLALMYLLGLALVPGLTFAFTRQGVPLPDLVAQTVLLVGVPIAASQPLRRWPRIDAHRTTAVSVSFFFLVFTISGSTRATLLSRPDLLVALSGLSILRTFGIGLAAFLLSRRLRLPREDRIAVTAFASFKNLGLTIVLAFAVFGPEASLPSIVALVFEISWLATLPILFRSTGEMPSRPDRGPLVANDPGAEVEGDDERQGVDEPVREHGRRVRREGETRVPGQAEGPDRDQVPREGRQAAAEGALPHPAVDEPGDHEAGNVAPQDLEDGAEVRRNPIQGGVRAEEPTRQGEEGDEDQEADEAGPSRRGGSLRRSALPQPGRRSAHRPRAEVEGDDHDHGVHEDRRALPFLDEQVGIRRGHEEGDEPPDAAARKP